MNTEKTGLAIAKAKTIVNEAVSGAERFGAILAWAMHEATALNMSRADFDAAVDISAKMIGALAAAYSDGFAAAVASSQSKSPEDVLRLVTQRMRLDGWVNADVLVMAEDLEQQARSIDDEMNFKAPGRRAAMREAAIHMRQAFQSLAKLHDVEPTPPKAA